MDTGVIIPETENTYTVYWSALPEAMRDVLGDPFGGPDRIEGEFREYVENYLIASHVAGDGNVDGVPPEVEWDDAGDLPGLTGYIQLGNASETEDMASFFAVDVGAFQILQIDDSTYAVCGMQPVPGGGWFDWQLVIGDAGDGLSADAARWSGQAAP